LKGKGRGGAIVAVERGLEVTRTQPPVIEAEGVPWRSGGGRGRASL